MKKNILLILWFQLMYWATQVSMWAVIGVYEQYYGQATF